MTEAGRREINCIVGELLKPAARSALDAVVGWRVIGPGLPGSPLFGRALAITAQPIVQAIESIVQRCRLISFGAGVGHRAHGLECAALVVECRRHEVPKEQRRWP